MIESVHESPLPSWIVLIDDASLQQSTPIGHLTVGQSVARNWKLEYHMNVGCNLRRIRIAVANCSRVNQG